MSIALHGVIFFAPYDGKPEGQEFAHPRHSKAVEGEVVALQAFRADEGVPLAKLWGHFKRLDSRTHGNLPLGELRKTREDWQGGQASSLRRRGDEDIIKPIYWDDRGDPYRTAVIVPQGWEIQGPEYDDRDSAMPDAEYEYESDEVTGQFWYSAWSDTVLNSVLNEYREYWNKLPWGPEGSTKDIITL